MRKTMLGMATLLLALSTVAPGWAASAGERAPANRDALEVARMNARWRAVNSKGLHSLEARNEERRLQGLIERLEAGQDVDPAEVDRELR